MEKSQTPPVWQTSFHRGRMETEPSTISFEKVFQLIISERYRDMTEKYRYYLSTGDLKSAKSVKDSSEFITASAVCEGGRTLKHVVSYTSVLMGDIDKLPKGVAGQLIAKLKGDPHVLLAHETLSAGVHIFFPVDMLDKSLHSTAYKQALAYFERLTGYPLDGQCKNLTRTANLCYDPAAYYNLNALPLHIDTPAAGKKPSGRPSKMRHAVLSEAVPAVLASLAGQGKTYEPGRHNEFISCAVYQMNHFGVPSAEVSGWIRSDYPEFDAAELAGIIRSVYEGHAGEHGSKDLPKPQGERAKYASIAELEAFISTQAEIRRNVITERNEISFFDEEEGFRNLEDYDENTLWRRANRSGVFTAPKFVHPVLNSEFVPKYNPFIRYFEQLPPWDGVTDHIGELAETVQTATPEMFRFCFRKWFVALVAAILAKKVVNHEILVLIGEQGSFKTTWFNRLLPPELEQYFYTKINCARANKDDQLTLAEFALVCFEEIESMRPTELNQLKAMITMPAVNERAAYAYNKSHRPHIASFCGTGNNVSFLCDPTGNRRWLPFEVVNITDPHAYRINYEGVYAQALHLFRHKFRYWFTQEEIKRLNAHNERFEAPNLEEELIRMYYRKPLPGETGAFIATAGILQRINAMIKTPLSATKIGIIMRKIGFDCYKNNGYRGYRIVELSPSELTENKRITEEGNEQKRLF